MARSHSGTQTVWRAGVLQFLVHAEPLIESALNIPPRRWGVTAQFRQAFSLSSGARHCLECQSVVEGSETTAATEVLSSNTLLFCTCVEGNLDFAGYVSETHCG